MALERPHGFLEAIDLAFRNGDDRVDEKHVELRNMDIVRQVYESLAHGDLEAAINLFHADIEFEITGPPSFPMVGRSRGRAESGEMMMRNFGLIESMEPDVQVVVAQGDTVVVIAHETGRIRATGTPYASHWVQVCTVKEGQITSFREIVDGYDFGGVQS